MFSITENVSDVPFSLVTSPEVREIVTPAMSQSLSTHIKFGIVTAENKPPITHVIW